MLNSQLKKCVKLLSHNTKKRPNTKKYLKSVRKNSVNYKNHLIDQFTKNPLNYKINLLKKKKKNLLSYINKSYKHFF